MVQVIRPGAVGGVSQSTCPEDNVDDCVQAFLRLGPLVTSGAPRLHGQGQLKYWVCHDTNSATNPMVLINVAAPAAFGAHLRQGDTVFIRRTPGGPLTTVQMDTLGRLIVRGPDRGPFPARSNGPITIQLCPDETPPSTNDVGQEDCVALFQSMGADVTSGAARAHGQGQLKYWVCHHTGSASNPFVLINVAAPAAFGAHLRQGDIIFIRRTAGGPLTLVYLNSEGDLVIDGPDLGPFTARQGSPFATA